MFVRARLAQHIQPAAYLVPQPAVLRDPVGRAQLFVVGPDNRATERVILAERTLGTDWVVTDGLHPGDRVIVQGLDNLKPGAMVKPVPADTPQIVRAAGPGAQPTGK
jgi:membrane fusion protein (multidrug efflux system)